MSLKRTIMLCTAMALVGCNAVKPAPGGEEKAAPTAPTAPKPPAEKPVPAAPPAAAPKPTPPAGPKQLLKNGRFEEWNKEGQPADWTGTTKTLGRAEEFTSGEGAVELQAGDKEEYTILQQAVPTVPKGKKLLVSAKIKAAGPEGVALKAVYFAGGKEMEARVQYKGKGDWKVTSFETTLPADATPSSFRFQVVRGPEAEGTVLVDDAAVIVQP